jgi:hypothetical protein
MRAVHCFSAVFLVFPTGCLANYLRMSPQYILTFIFFEQIQIVLGNKVQ